MANSKFQIYRREDGDYGWRLRDGNSQVIAVSGEGLGKIMLRRASRMLLLKSTRIRRLFLMIARLSLER